MRGRRILLTAALVCLGGWLIYLLAGRAISAELARRFGETILRLGQGKFSDASSFLDHRLFEVLWLLTLGVVAGTCIYVFHLLLKRRSIRNGWVHESLLAFVILNLWVGFAGNTCLFWATLYTGQSNHNLVQFHFKRLLLRENPARPQALLLGSSQTRAQIDEVRLNEILGERLWTTELHYPGARAYDLLLTMRRVASQRPDYVICYLSESYFFTGVRSEGLPYFLRLSDLADGWRFKSYPVPSAKGFGYGLLGDVLPLFRYRDAFVARVFGITFAGLGQSQYLAGLDSDLNRRARQTASSYQFNQESEFQMAALEKFIEEAQQVNAQVLLCVGQVNPTLAQALAPELRVRMRAFLESLPRRHANLKLIEEDALPPQTTEDYEDLTHATRSAQERFTRCLAAILAKMLPSQSAGN
jgi:hypothetical protein